MKVVILGSGSIGKRHLRNLSSMGIDNISIYDPLEERLTEASAINQKAKLFKNCDDIFKEKFDIAFVCSPPDSHMEYASRSLDNGAHCFVEKPFSLDPVEVPPVIEKAKSKNLKIMTGFNMRYLYSLKKIKEMLDAGLIGRLLSIRMGLSSYMPDWHPWEDYRECFMAFKKTGGGALFDYVHGVDLAMWFGGDVTWVLGSIRTNLLEMETDDTAMIILETKNGVNASLYFDFLDRSSRKCIDLIGIEGTVIWYFDGAEDKVSLYLAKEKSWRIYKNKPNYDACYIDEIAAFLQAIKEDRNVESDGIVGLKTMYVLKAIQESSSTGKKIYLNL